MTRLYVRLFLWFCAANLVTLVLSAWLTDRFAERSATRFQPEWGLLAETTLQRYESGANEGLRRWAHRLRVRGIEVALLDSGGRPIALPLPPGARDRLPQLLATGDVVLELGQGHLLAAVPLTAEDGRALWFVAERQARRPRPPPLPFVLQLFVAALVIAAIGWWLARGLTRPIVALQTASRGFAGGELEARVGRPHIDRRDELGQLARDFDAMADRIQASVEHTRGLLQDISHELRSPLARLQLALELAKRTTGVQGAPALERAQREVSRLDRVIGEVLALARLEAKLPSARREPVALAELVVQRVEELRPSAAERDVRIQLTANDATVLADRALLARAIDNLLDNALKFSPAGGVVEVELGADGSTARLSIADRGPGVPADELQRLRQPFYRGRNAGLADGQGVGLAIVERVVMLHDGRLTLGNRETGGFRARIDLALATGPKGAR